MKSLIITSIISMLINPGNSPVLFDNPTNIIQTPYGTATKDFWYSTESDPIDTVIGTVRIPAVGYVSSFTYTFTRPSTGNFTVTTMNNLTNYELYVEGGYLVSVGTNSFTFRVNYSTEFKCTVIVNNSAHPSWNYQQFLTFENQSITQYDTVNEIVDDTLQYVTSIDGNVQTMNASITTIKNILLQSLGGYITNDGSLYTDVQTLISTISQLNQTAVSLDIPIYSQGIYQVLSNNDTTKVYHDLYGNYVNVDSTNTFTTYLYNGSSQIMVYEANATNVYPVFTNSNITATVIRTLRTSGVITYLISIQNNAGNGTYTFTFNNSSNTRKIYPLYFGFNSTIPSELIYATRGYFSDPYTEKLDDVIDAIGNMALNVNQMTVNATGITYNTTEQNVDNSITTYNTNINTVQNIENNFKLAFDDANENYQLFDFSASDDFVNSSTFMSSFVNQLYGFDIIKYPLTILLLGVIIIAILG